VSHYLRDDQVFGGGVGFQGLSPINAAALFGVELRDSVVLSVATTGSDTDATRPSRIVAGDWSAHPFATIQAAINATPRVGHTLGSYTTQRVAINVGAGSFAGFILSGHHIGISINGSRAASTLASGPNSGTATSATSRTLTLTGAGWTAEDLVGRFLNIVSGAGAGQIVPIAANTTDTLTLSAVFTSLPGGTSMFTIEDCATIINTVPSGVIAPVFITECSGNVVIQDLIVPAATSSRSFSNTYNAGYVKFQRCTSLVSNRVTLSGSMGAASAVHCVIKDATYGLSVGQGYATLQGCLLWNCATGVRVASGAQYLSLSFGNYFKGCTTGLELDGVTDCYSSDMIFDTCGTALWLKRSHFYASGLTIQNTVTRTFSLFASTMQLLSLLAGASNAGFGLNAKGSGVVVELNGSFTPTIAGASGDVTVDGSTDVTWAALASTDSYAVDATTGARINRQ